MPVADVTLAGTERNGHMPNAALGKSKAIRNGEVVEARKAVTVTPVSLVIQADLSLATWLEQGHHLGRTARASAWWIGDWIAYGNARFGEKYVRAAKKTGYDAQTLMNMSYVASRFEISRRRENLSWSHHAEVAALEPDEQARWLDLAEKERLSVHCLRLELRQAMRSNRRCASPSVDGKDGDAEIGEPVACPACGHEFQIGR
jgi:hypothetical protein